VAIGIGTSRSAWARLASAALLSALISGCGGLSESDRNQAAPANTGGSGGTASLKPLPDVPDSVSVDRELLARRLAHLIWDSVPDAALRQALADREPLDGERVGALADEMLTDPRAPQGVSAFYRQWLRLGSLEELRRPEGFTISLELADAMRAEVDAIVTRLTLEGGVYGQLYSDEETRIQPPLAAFYGVPEFDSEGLTIELDGFTRSGLFTTPGVLARFSSKSAPSWPTQRGGLVTAVLLCLAIPPEPQSVDLTLPPTLPIREDVEQQMGSQPSCAGCHDYLDPVGYAFLPYDTLGRWDESDGPFDTSGHVKAIESDPAFADRFELFRLLQQAPEASACFSRQWLRYGLDVDDFGAELPESAGASVDFVVAGFEASGKTLRQVIIEVTRSPAFLEP
jgi:hypothetical protein